MKQTGRKSAEKKEIADLYQLTQVSPHIIAYVAPTVPFISVCGADWIIVVIY